MRATEFINKQQGVAEGLLNEFATDSGGGGDDILKTLAAQWLNGDVSSGDLDSDIQSQEKVERRLEKGVTCPDGVKRKLYIDYSDDYEGVVIYGDDNWSITYKQDDLSESHQGVAEGSENLNYIGNCTDDDVIEHIFGDATGFAQAVDEYGDEFTLDDLVVKYDPETDVHSFYYKEQGLAEGLNQYIPSVLYHATYKPRLKSIKLKGLGAGTKKNWEDSKPGIVYLALDPNVAESYAESSDMVPDEWLDQIVILKISTAGLDPNKFGIDSNVQDNSGDTVEYHGVIPVSNISLYKQGVAEGSGFDQEAGIGIDGKSFKFKIRDLVALADNYPVTKIDPQQFSKQIAGRDEDSTQSMARTEKADLQYPIIVVKRQNGQLWIADGTHRAHKAIMHKLPSINAKIIPIKDMAPFDVEQGVAEGSDAEAYKEKLLTTLPQMMRFFEKNGKGWKPSKEQMLAAVETGYTVMKHTGDVKQAGKAMMDELNRIQPVAEGTENNLSTIIQSFVASPVGQKYKKHDCKTVTRAFVAWAEQNKIPTTVVSLAPPSADFIAKNPRYEGKSGQGDGHIMPIVNGNAIDFTVRQFGVSRPFNNPLVTPTSSLPAVYGKFGYFTDKPEWFLGGKSHWIGALNSIPSEIFNQNFGDELLEQGMAEGRSKDFAERHYAAREIEKIIENLLSSESLNVTPEIFKKIKELVAITGRSQDIRYFGSAGELIDKLTDVYRQSQIRSGQMPQFTGRAAAARDMARQIANQTRGTYRYFKPQTWTTRFGQRYRDPADYVVYPDQQSYDDALEWIENKGKKVRYRDNFGGLTDATQIGSYIIEPSTFTQDAFSDTPQTTHRISVRLAKTINQGGRQQVDITDQQAAALQDIASTKSQNAIQSIQLILKVLQGEQDIKQIIDNSKKITPQDKAKLDAIITGAKNFQEPNQGMSEGSEEINWIKPNFDYEWEEIEFQAKLPQVPADVRNYMAKHFPNKQAWMKSVQHGRPVVVSPNHGQKIRNYTDNKKDLLNALSPQSHDPQGPAKAKRVNALFDKGGPIEMPIILKTNKGLWLIGGKTRLGTANLLKGIPAKVWMIGGEQDVAEAWSEKYKRSINCDNPNGFSQRAHCQGRKKNNEQIELDERKKKRKTTKKKTNRYFYGPAYYGGYYGTGEGSGDGGGGE